jgi:hypothetical protein
LEKDQANGQRMRAELKKIVNLPDLPERLSAIIAAWQGQCQPLFAIIANLPLKNVRNVR